VLGVTTSAVQISTTLNQQAIYAAAGATHTFESFNMQYVYVPESGSFADPQGNITGSGFLVKFDGGHAEPTNANVATDYWTS